MKIINQNVSLKTLLAVCILSMPQVAIAQEEGGLTLVGDDDNGAVVIDTGEAIQPPPADELVNTSIAAPVDTEEEDVFFDAEALVPKGEIARKGAARKVDPKVSPATRLVVVRKNSEAGGKPAQLVAAERAVKLGRFDSALEIYDRLYATNKRDPNILMGRAITLQKLGLADEAITAYEELLKIRPKNIDAQINMIGIMAERYPAVALRRLDDLSKNNPRNVGVMAQAAFIHAKIQNFPDAIRLLGMAASLEPRNAGHLYNMAIIADQAGSSDEAIKYYEKALETDALYGSSKSIPRDAVYERLAQLR